MSKTKDKPKVIAKKKSAATTDKITGSLIKCEVNLEKGEWVTPDSCKTFYIDEDATFPDVLYEIKTDEPGPYEWSWDIKWVVNACPQKSGKPRFKPKTAKTFSKKGNFHSDSKKWKADLGAVVGGDLTVRVKAGATTFVRKTFIRGKNPAEEKINAELDTYKDKDDVNLVKKIFKQESRGKHLYSDEMPLVSFDNGYSLGQLTNPQPSYEQVWNWKEHVKAVMTVIKDTHRKSAKNYLDQHGNYTNEMYDLETLASYNGIPRKQRYHNWDGDLKKWVKNTDVICDPAQSNKGWIVTETENKGKSLDELLANPKSKPIYTGRCYAEHINNQQ